MTRDKYGWKKGRLHSHVTGSQWSILVLATVLQTQSSTLFSDNAVPTYSASSLRTSSTSHHLRLSYYFINHSQSLAVSSISSLLSLRQPLSLHEPIASSSAHHSKNWHFVNASCLLFFSFSTCWLAQTRGQGHWLCGWTLMQGGNVTRSILSKGGQNPKGLEVQVVTSPLRRGRCFVPRFFSCNVVISFFFWWLVHFCSVTLPKKAHSG